MDSAYIKKLDVKKMIVTKYAIRVIMCINSIIKYIKRYIYKSISFQKYIRLYYYNIYISKYIYTYIYNMCVYNVNFNI